MTDSTPSASAKFWDAAAKENAAWYVATAYSQENPEFFAQGAVETDSFLAFCEVSIDPQDTVLEIGSGVGRMTRHLAQLGKRVIATDVSSEMLSHARKNLAAQQNVEFVLVPGNGTLPIESETVDVVFSYIVLQHVPTVDEQIRYLREAIRVLRPGGRMAVQVRASGVSTIAHEWGSFAAHLIKGRKTLNRAWRGAHIPRSRLEALESADVAIELRRFSSRHIWVVARKS